MQLSQRIKYINTVVLKVLYSFAIRTQSQNIPDAAAAADVPGIIQLFETFQEELHVHLPGGRPDAPVVLDPRRPVGHQRAVRVGRGLLVGPLDPVGDEHVEREFRQFPRDPVHVPHGDCVPSAGWTVAARLRDLRMVRGQEAGRLVVRQVQEPPDRLADDLRPRSRNAWRADEKESTSRAV